MSDHGFVNTSTSPLVLPGIAAALVVVAVGLVQAWKLLGFSVLGEARGRVTRPPDRT